ncbi:MAG TPA: TetR/AcrR family transcriptional regulator [Ohtaekwangia sp.]|nr:TetR/AcrR family transcriptional regulator [Ohtaekwangia sp.]
MTIATRKERQKEELRAKILQHARELFIERGYEETSIRNIAERIEYSPTTIYLYFKDKDDIFFALHQEGFALLNQYFRSLANVEDPFERLKAISKAYVRFALENREFYDLMFISDKPMNALCKEDDKEWDEGQKSFGALVQTVTECIDKGYFKGMDPETLSFTLWAMVHGVASLEICGRCSVLTEEKQTGLAERSTKVVIDMLERMHPK